MIIYEAPKCLTRWTRGMDTPAWCVHLILLILFNQTNLGHVVNTAGRVWDAFETKMCNISEDKFDSLDEVGMLVIADLT